MGYTYEQRKKQNSETNGSEPHSSSGEESVLPNSAQLSQMGHQVGMPEVMREKMEDSFGMDLSSVKLYENKAVGDAGAEAVAQGSKIAFAPGKLDFSSMSGQELLGHEISHVASQARGEVQRSGFVNDSALEARADKEGSMAARGESISAPYGGASSALSSASAASAAAPMQAKSGKKSNKERERAEMESIYSDCEADEDEALDNQLRDEKVDKLFRLTAAYMRQGDEYKMDLDNKKQELIPKYYDELKNKGLEEWDAQDDADTLARKEAKSLIKEDDYRYLSDEEEEWLQNMYQNPNLDVMREATRRRSQLGEDMVKQRQNLGAERPNEDEGKLDLETAYSSTATNYNVYDFIQTESLTNNDENTHYINAQLKKEDNKKKTPEIEKIQEKAQKIAYESISNNPYLETPEGKDQHTKLKQQYFERLGELSGKKKRLRSGKH